MRILIIGAGIAGTFLARALVRRGVSVQVVDDASAPSASRAAAGLVNPIIGIRMTLVPGVDRWMATARDTFRDLEQILGRTVWHPLPIDRVFRDPGEAARWSRRAGEPDYQEWFEALPTGAPHAPHGGIRIRGGGWFDYRCLPDLLRVEGIPIEKRRIDPGAIRVKGSGGGVGWEDWRGDAVVFCRGHAAADPWFPDLPWKAARGEILTLRATGGPRDSIWMRGVFVIPLGDGRYRVGSTYRWSGFDEEACPLARAEILDGWRDLGLPDPEVEDHRFGVRPILQDRQPVAGRHPVHPAIWILNGLGSRGALLAPTLADRLAESILDGASLDPAWDVARFNRGGTGGV